MHLKVLRRGLSLFAVLLLVSGSVAGAVEYGGLGGIPANPDPNNPRTKSIFVHTIIPGQTKNDAVNVINNTNEAKTVEVYAADSEIASGGSFACRQKADEQKAVGSWIRLAQSEVVLPPSGNQVIPFKISLPNTVSVGEHNGCIVIQEKAAVPAQAGSGVQLNFRSALRVAITVPGDIVKDIEFTSLSVKPESKKYTLTVKLTNKGNVSLDTDVQVYITNWFGKNVYKNGGIYPLLAQATPAEFNFEYPQPFWGGFFRIKGTADYNGDASVPLGSPAPKNVRKDTPGQWLFVTPQPKALALELLALVLLVISVWVILGRIRGRRKTAKTWKTFTVEEGDTLVALARSYHVNWKTIARVNKLRAPYHLRPGSKIKLPAKTKDK